MMLNFLAGKYWVVEKKSLEFLKQKQKKLKRFEKIKPPLRARKN